MTSFSGLLDIELTKALTLGIASVIGVGVAYNSYKFVRKIVDDIPPKKFVLRQLIASHSFTEFCMLLDGAESVKFLVYGAFPSNHAGR